MLGRDLKAEAVRAAVPLYCVATAAGMHPNKLSALLSGRAHLDAEEAARIRKVIEGLSTDTAPAGAAR